MPSRADLAPAHVWAEELADPGARLALDEEESRYVARVCRGRLGETVTLTDGRGGVAGARIEALAPRVRVVVMNLERRVSTRRAELWCGPPEGERADWLVEKLAELGLAVFQPVHCARGPWGRAPSRVERWRRLARAALRQSRGCFGLEVRAPVGWDQALSALPAEAELLLADPDGEPAGARARPEQGSCVAVVGPAAGLDAREMGALIVRGFMPISLSERRLRTETAAMAWAAWWAAPLPGSRPGKARGPMA